MRKLLHNLLKRNNVHVVNNDLHSLLLLPESCWAALFDILYDLVVLG